MADAWEAGQRQPSRLFVWGRCQVLGFLSAGCRTRYRAPERRYRVPRRWAGCSRHAPNEHLPPALLREALKIMTGLYWDLGQGHLPPLSESRNRRQV